MENEPNQQPSRLKPWVAPLAVASVCVIVLGLVGAYVNLTVGALIALLGLVGVIVVGYQASRSVDS